MAAIVGRKGELTVLRALARELAEGRGRAVLVEGEAGIGKSALVRTALTDITGRADSTRQPDTTVPWTVLRDDCDDPTRPFPLHEVSAAASLPAPEDDLVTAAIERSLSLVGQLCAAGPVMFVLENLHWADEPTLLFWRRLCRIAARLPLLAVGTCRPAPMSTELQRLRRDLLARGGTLITLAGLSRQHVATLTRQLVGATPGPGLLDQLDAAAGNPLFVHEMVAAISHREHPAQPWSAAIGGRMDHLSAGALEMLRLAVILEREFTVPDLETLTGKPPIDLVDAVSETMSAGVLEPTGDQLRFRHDLIRQALYDQIPAGTRTSLRRHAARALSEAGAPVKRVARVLAAVTEPPDDWSLDWLARNAQALARRAPGAAASLLERALADLDVHDSRHTVLREQLAMAYFTLTRYERAEVTAAILAQRESDAGDPGKSVWLRTHALMRLNRYQEAIKALESAARIAQPLWRARFIALRALCLYDSWQYAAAGESVAEAVALNRDRSDPIATSHVLYVRSALSMHNHDMGAALRDIDKGLTIGDGTAPVEDVHVLMLANRAYLQFETGRIDESATTARHAIAMAENTGSPRLNQLRVAAAAQAYERGDWDEAATELELAEGPDTSQTPGWHGLMALIEGRRGKARQMSVHLRALAELDNETVIPHASMLLPWNASRLAAAALESERAGRPGRAAGILGRCLGPDILLRRRYRARYKVLPELIRLALAHGDEATALAAARACAQDAADGADDSSPIYWTDRWCAGVIGREPARVLAAADYFRAAGLRPSLAGALQDAAVLLSSQPDPGPARAALAEALRTYDELGASWDARQATERLRAHGIRVDARRRRRPAHGWQSLSAAELPVARLAAEGLSNPGIAARLHISRRTVESHVSRILSKLEISSRVQIGDMAEP